MDKLFPGLARDCLHLLLRCTRLPASILAGGYEASERVASVCLVVDSLGVVDVPSVVVAVDSAVVAADLSVVAVGASVVVVVARRIVVVVVVVVA